MSDKTENGLEPFLSMQSKFGFMGIKHWFKSYRTVLCTVLCRVGIHEWMKMKYRKKDRMLIVWEECCRCHKVKEP